MSFQSVDLVNPEKDFGLLLSGMEVSISAGRMLAVMALDNQKQNPLELLMERYFDPSSGRVVSTIIMTH